MIPQKKHNKFLVIDPKKNGILWIAWQWFQHNCVKESQQATRSIHRWLKINKKTIAKQNEKSNKGIQTHKTELNKNSVIEECKFWTEKFNSWLQQAEESANSKRNNLKLSN